LLIIIIRGWNCINTASGIMFSVSDRPVCRLRRKWLDLGFLLNLQSGRSFTERCCINTIPPHDDEHSVARNMYRITIIKVLYDVILHQVGHLPRVNLNISPLVIYNQYTGNTTELFS